MKKLLAISLSFISFQGVGQTVDWIETSIAADSIVAIRHSIVDGPMTRLVDHQGNRIKAPDFYVDGDVNTEIVVQRVRLNENQIETFVRILQSSTEVSMRGNCFDPHNALLIYTKGELKYIDYCFDCDNLTTGPMELNPPEMNGDQWKQLYQLFMDLGLIKEYDK